MLSIFVRRRAAHWRAAFAAAFLAGSALVAPAARAQDIVIGQIAPFTVLVGTEAHEINKGAKALFAQVNARGGVNGRKLSFFELDDKYDPEEFARQLELAMQRKPVALISPLGSTALAKLLRDKLLDKHEVVVVNAVPGADVFRAPGHRNLFHVRASDRRQIEKIVQHARTLHISRMHVVYQDLPIGASGFAATQEAARNPAGFAVQGVETRHDEAALAAAAQRVAAAGTQSVLVIGRTQYAADAVNHLRKAGVGQMIFTLSYLPAELVSKVAGENAARGVGIAQTYPNPMGVSLPVQREFSAAMKAADPQLKLYTAFHIEGYLAARVLVEGLRRSGDARPESLAKALRAGEMDFGGFRVNFSQSNEGSNFVDIGVVSSSGRLTY